jgi:hypothetical protein
MNYEFHVGDYVETVDEWVGYIESIHDLLHGVTGLYVRFADDDCQCFEVTDKTISNNFARIGAYDFTKKEKKRIEPIGDCNKHIFANAIKSDNQLVRMVSDDILNKINELVDAVNLLMDKDEDR